MKLFLSLRLHLLLFLIEYGLLLFDYFLLLFQLLLHLPPPVGPLSQLILQHVLLVLLVSLQHLAYLIEVIVKLAHEPLLLLSRQLHHTISLQSLKQLSLLLICIFV